MNKAEGFFDDPERPSARVIIWVAHKLWFLLPVAIAIRVLTYLSYEQSWAKVTESIFTWSLIVVFAFAAIHSQTTSVCSKCFDEVPNNASEMAARRRLFLWVNHQNGWKLWAVCFAVVFIQLAGSLTKVTWVEILSSIPGDVFLFGIIYSFWAHHRLSLFCPWCKDWGDEDRVPEPDPSGKNYIH